MGFVGLRKWEVFATGELSETSIASRHPTLGDSSMPPSHRCTDASLCFHFGHPWSPITSPSAFWSSHFWGKFWVWWHWSDYQSEEKGKPFTSYFAWCQARVDHLSPLQEAAKADPVIQECDEAGITLQVWLVKFEHVWAGQLGQFIIFFGWWQRH